MLKKNGTKGILYRTRAPKLVPAIPTPNANKIEKIKQYNKKGSLNKILTNLIGEILIKIIIVKTNKITFSITDKTIVGLPISQNCGLKRAVKIAKGATEINPPIEPSSCPIL